MDVLAEVAQRVVSSPRFVPDIGPAAISKEFS